MDQAAGLRKAARPTPPALAVVSGKGGVGKSNLTVNLAYLLSASGQRALLVDADLGTANADILLGLIPPYSMADVAAGRCSLRQAVVTGPGGLLLVPGVSGVEGLQALNAQARQRLFAELTALGAGTALTLLDCGAGVSRSVLSFAAAAGQALVVTTPEPTALTDAYALIKGLQHLGVQVQLVVNRAQSQAAGRQAASRLQAACQRFLGLDLPLLGVVPEDGHVGRAVQAQQPCCQLFPGCPASRALQALLINLGGRAQPGRAGLWQRLGQLLGR